MKTGLVGVGVLALLVVARLFLGAEATATRVAATEGIGPTGEVATPTLGARAGGGDEAPEVAAEAPGVAADGAAEAPGVAVEPTASTAGAPPSPTPSTPRLERAAPSQEAPPRRRRWRNYNRYPGPIPTPEEWRPPEGPVRIGLQVGHWRTAEAPPELFGLRRNGASWNGTAEWEVNLEIARVTGAMLEDLGYLVDILPAVVPPDYRAHLLLAIHADASNDATVSGFRVAAPSRDATGRASGIVDLLNRTYGPATGIKRLPTATRRMRNYYAFNFRRYEHAAHPMTISAIIETGFLTNAGDREVIIGDPERVARGIVDAITAFPVTPPPGRVGAPS